MSKLIATRYEVFFDDTRVKPYSFRLESEDGCCLYNSAKSYETKAAACSVASRMLTGNFVGLD